MHRRPLTKAFSAIALAGSLVAVASPVQAASDLPALAWSPVTAPGAYDFGRLDGSGGQTASVTFTLSNSGGRSSGTVELALSGSSAFTLTSDGCSGSAVPGGRSCAVTVEFAPGSSGGVDAATLTAAGEQASAALALTGSGGITVCASGCSYATVEAAVDAAPAGATVTIGAGAYAGQISITKDVTIAGAGAGQTILTGGAPIVTIAAGSTATISGVTVSGAVGGILGGGIHNEGTLALRSCTVSGNSASTGGGIYNATGASVTLTDCTVSGNSAGNGGGIYSIGGGGSVALTNTTVSGNSASGNGGGVFTGTGSVQSVDSTVSGNTAGSEGGGVFSNGGSLSATGGAVAGNSALVGGGVYNLGGTASLAGGGLSSNTAALGGGLYNTNAGSAALSTETVASNSASLYGGGIYTASGTTLSVTGSSLTGNKAGAAGGAVYKAGTVTATFSGDTFSGNTPDACAPTAC